MNEGKKLPENVRALGLVSLVNDMASDMIIPLLPAFVTSVLGFGPAFLGVIEGIAETTASLLKLVSGWYSDRIRRRKAFAVSGYALSNAVRPLIGLATAGWHVLVLRFFDRVGKGVRTSPRDALVASSIQSGEWGRAFGFQRAMDNFGAALGPLIAAAFLWLFPNNLRALFLLSVIPGAFVMWILVTKVRDEAPAAPVAPNPAKPKATLSEGLPTGAFRTYLLAVVLFTLGNSTDMFLILRAQETGVSLAAVPVLWALLGIVRAATGTAGGSVADRIGRRRAVLLGWMLYAIVYAGFGFAKTPSHIWALFVAYGLYYSLVEGAERALVAELVPEDRRGAAYGWFHLAVGVGAFPSSVLFGLIWKFGGAGAAFVFGSVMAFAGSAVLFRMKKA